MKRAFIFLALSLFFSPYVHAEEKITVLENVETTELDDIVITGSRVETKLKDTPLTINVITPEEVETVKYRNAGDLLKRIPGVYTQNFGGEEELTSIRVPTHFSNSYTILLIDGLPATSYGESAGGLLREINGSNVDRIEVIKGPASALYGSNAIGGVINVITRKPSATPRFEIWGEAGEFDQYRGGISGSGVKGDFGINMDISMIDAEEWRENADHTKEAGTLTVEKALNSVSSLLFKLDYLDQDNALSGTLEKEDYDRNWRQSYHNFNRMELTKWMPSLSYWTDIGEGGMFKTSLLVRDIDHTVNPNYGIRFNQRTRSYSGYISEIDATDVDYQALFSQRIGFLQSRLVTGVDLSRGDADMATRDLLVIRDPATKKYTSYTDLGISKAFDVGTDVIAPYAEWSSTVLPRLNLTFGGRYDRVSYDIEDKADSGITEGEDTFSRLSPKIGAVYSVNDSINFFVTYAQGFVVPSSSQLFTGRGSNENLDPEKANNYEAGMRSRFLKGLFSLDTSLYHMTIKDKIIVQTVDPVTAAIEYHNVGETSHKGVEVSAVYSPMDRMHLALDYTYAENHYEEYRDPVLSINYNGNSMPLSPKNRLNARLSLMPVERLGMELEMDLEGKQYIDDENTKTYHRPALMNFRAAYEWNQWSFWTQVVNLTDDKYATRVTMSNGSEFYYPGSPRTAFIGASWEWGA